MTNILMIFVIAAVSWLLIEATFLCRNCRGRGKGKLPGTICPTCNGKGWRL